MPSLMVLDVGNTNIVAGLYDARDLKSTFRIFTDRTSTADEYALKLKALLREENFNPGEIENIGISCVVPAIAPVLEELSLKLTHKKALFVSASLDMNISIDIDNPLELGADMIASAVAAFEEFGGPAVILDFGTATTISAVSRDGRFLGAAIAPGLETSCEAIYRRAPHLTRIKLHAPPSPIGRNTMQAMQSGILLGHASLVDGMVERFLEILGEEAQVIATGGLAELVRLQSKRISVVRPFMILEGIRLLVLRHRACPPEGEEMKKENGMTP